MHTGWRPTARTGDHTHERTDQPEHGIRHLAAAGNPIPNKFVYEGRIVFILNDMTGRDAARLALNTRIPTIEYTNVSNADVFTFMDEVLCRHGNVISTGIGPVRISRADCLAVINHIRASTAYGLADLRMLEFGLKCFHDNKTGDAWKSLLDRFIAGANTSASHAAIKGARERLVLDLEANPAFPTIEARMAEFMRLERCADRTYWRYRKKAGLSESNNVLYSNYGLGPSPVTRRCKDCDKLYRISEYGAVDGTGTKDVCRYCQARPCLQCGLPYPVWEHRASTGGFCAGCHKHRSVTPGPKAIAKGIAKFFKAIWAIYLTAKPQPLDADGNWTPPVKAVA